MIPDALVLVGAGLWCLLFAVAFGPFLARGYGGVGQ